eukprot:3750605-Prymnesium_polylepis.2
MMLTQERAKASFCSRAARSPTRACAPARDAESRPRRSENSGKLFTFSLPASAARKDSQSHHVRFTYKYNAIPPIGNPSHTPRAL